MAIRQRSWISGTGRHSTWVADYADQNGKRYQKAGFKTKKEAQSWLNKAQHEVEQGTHTPESDSITIADAAKLWIQRCEIRGREPTTIRHYRYNIDLHINPFLGSIKLARLSTPRIEQYVDELLTGNKQHKKLTPVMARKVLVSLKSLIKDAQRRGLVAQNVAQPVSVPDAERHKPQPKIGIDIPSREEVRRIADHCKPSFRPMFLTAAFTGMRASELRGLTWANVDFSENKIHVMQRADRYNTMGAPKSKTSRRSIPMVSIVRNALIEWRESCPKSSLDLVFPSKLGTIQFLANIWTQFFAPAQKAAGVVDAKGKPKYSFHSLRHFFASWVIDQGFPPKKLQALLGHWDIGLTMNTYTHLFPDDEEDARKFELGALKIMEPALKPKRSVALLGSRA